MKYILKNINDYNDEQLKEFYKKISESKKEKIDKLINYDDKKRSIIGEILLSELLENKSYDYTYNEYGKPFIKDSNIFYNISHSYDYIACVISEKQIGIDIEMIREVPLNTINQFATEKEKEYISNSNERLFQIYTLKEAYFKMLGTNLNNIFDVEFIINGNTIESNKDDINIIQFKHDNYIISIIEEK